MVRPLALASLIAFAVLPSLPGVARADGLAQVAPAPHAHRDRGTRLHHPRRWHGAPGVAQVPGHPPALVHGWLPRNLNLPIYNAPNEGPAPTL